MSPEKTFSRLLKSVFLLFFVAAVFSPSPVYAACAGNDGDNGNFYQPDCGTAVNTCYRGSVTSPSETPSEYLWSCTSCTFSRNIENDYCSVPKASCSYSGPLSWGACGASGSWSAPSGGSTYVDNQNSGYSGGGTFSCSNGSWSGPSGLTCTADAPLVVNGSCSSSHYGCSSGSSTSNSDGATSWTWTCSGSGGGSSPSCSEAKTCSAGYTLNSSGTCVSTPQVTYQTCSNGSVILSSESCPAPPPPATTCSFTGYLSWAPGCWANSTWSATYPNGVTVYNDSSNTGYTGSGTFTCNSNGTFSGPTGLNCTANISVVNGSCSSSHYGCSSGTSGSNVDGATSWTWVCSGSGGGSSPSCSETKPVWTPIACDTSCGESYPQSYSCSPAGTCTTAAPSTTCTRTSCAPASLSINVSPNSYLVTLPASTISATYALSNGTSANTNCRLLDYADTPLTSYTSCVGSMSVTAPTTAGGGVYGYSIQANKSSTGETVSSNFVVTVAAEPPASAPPPSQPLPTVSFSASPSTINNGQSSSLTWSSSNADSCTSAGGFSTGGAINNSSGVSVTPSVTSPYQIYCVGPGGLTYSNIVTVTVLSPSSSISVSKPRVSKGSSVTVSWTITDTSGCTITRNGALPAWKTGLSSPSSSSDTVTTRTTYSLSCPSVSTKSATVNMTPLFKEF